MKNLNQQFKLERFREMFNTFQPNSKDKLIMVGLTVKTVN